MRHRFAVLVASGLALTVLVAALPARDRERADADRAVTIRGRIVRVRPEDNQLTLKTRNKEVELRVGKGSRLQMDGQDVRLDQFKEGTRVRVTYLRQDGANRVVTLAPALIGNGEVQRGVREALQAARAYNYRQREEFQRRAQANLRELDERIADLQDRAEDAGQESRQQYQRLLEELRRRRDVAREKVARLKDASADNWEDIRAGAGQALDDLQQAYDQARTRFKDAARPGPDREK